MEALNTQGLGMEIGETYGVSKYIYEDVNILSGMTGGFYEKSYVIGRKLFSDDSY